MRQEVWFSVERFDRTSHPVSQNNETAAMLALLSQTDPVRGETFSNVKAIFWLQYARNINVHVVIQLELANLCC